VGWHRTCEQPSCHNISLLVLCVCNSVKGVITGALDDSLGVRENGCDCEAAGALDVHEEGPGTGYEGLELVLARFRRWRWVEEIDCENLIETALLAHWVSN
jgi:hypothetical protein